MDLSHTPCCRGTRVPVMGIAALEAQECSGCVGARYWGNLSMHAAPLAHTALWHTSPGGSRLIVLPVWGSAIASQTSGTSNKHDQNARQGRRRPWEEVSAL